MASLKAAAPESAKMSAADFRDAGRTDHRLPTRSRDFERWSTQEVDKWLAENQLKDVIDKKWDFNLYSVIKYCSVLSDC